MLIAFLVVFFCLFDLAVDLVFGGFDVRLCWWRLACLRFRVVFRCIDYGEFCVGIVYFLAVGLLCIVAALFSCLGFV